MAVLRNIARVYTPTVGVGVLTLGAAVQGYKTFIQAGCVNGEVVTYGIHDFNAAGNLIASEVGRGTYNAIFNTLARTTVLASTNADAALNLSGNAQVFITAIAEDFDHTASILNVGVNTHVQIDAHLASVANPHATTAAQVGAPALVNPSVVGNFVSFSNVTGGQQDSGVSAASFQPIDATLTTLSALADVTGFLYNNGAGVLAWTSPIPIANGGTGQITAQAAINALTAVSGATAGQVLTRTGTDAAWTSYILSGTAAKTYTFPATDQTIAGLAVTGQTFTTGQFIDGTANEIQLRVQAHSTNTNVVQYENSSGAYLYNLSSAGKHEFRAVDSSSTSKPVAFRFMHYTTATPSNGIGLTVQFTTDTTTVLGTLISQDRYYWANATHTARLAKIDRYIDDFNASRIYELIATDGTEPTTTYYGMFRIERNTATTNAVMEVLRITNTVTDVGVGAAGLGAAASFWLESATDTTNKWAGWLAAYIIDPTAATFTSAIKLSAVYQTTERIGLTIQATSAAVAIGFLGATPVVQQLSTVDLGVVLSNFGLRAAGTDYPITTSGTVTLSGNVYTTAMSSFDTLPVIDAGAAGNYYIGGFYDLIAASSTLTIGGTVTRTLGTALNAKAARALCVVSGPSAGATVLTVTGVSIDDNGVRNDADSEVLIADCSAVAANAFFQTSKKWLGQITYTLSGGAGGNALSFNYGFVRAKSNTNTNFTIKSLVFFALGGATDTGINLELLHHKTTGWTYSAAAFTYPTASRIIMLSTDYGTNTRIASGLYINWRRSNLATAIAGATGGEGYIVRLTTATNNSIRWGYCRMGFSTTA